MTEVVTLVRGQVLFEPGRVPSHAHFPLPGTMISLVLPLPDGGMADTLAVGAEGVAGVAVDPTDDGVTAFARGLVRLPGGAARVPTSELAKAARASSGLRRMLTRHAEALISDGLQAVACRGAHPVRARLGGWLLRAADRIAPASGAEDPVLLPLTQEVLADMLGVRRATAGEALVALREEGLIRLQRGGIEVRDRAGLERVACGCHAALRRRFDDLLAPGPADSMQTGSEPGR